MELSIIESKKGKSVLLYQGYKFYQRKVYKNSNILWICAKENCAGNVTTDASVITVLKTTKEHICAPDVAKSEVEVCIFKAKKRAREEYTPVTQIFREELMSATNKGLDFVTQIPAFSNVKQQLYSARHASLGIDTLPKHRNDIIIPEKYQDFVLFDETCEERILIFALHGGILLQQGTCFFGDGTFKACPLLFDQLYTIHMDIGSTREQTRVIPVIYALLPNRKEATYTRLYHILRSKIPSFKPLEFHIDFEKAAINGLRNVYPDVEIKGCNFHYNQAIWRKVQEIGLVAEYKNDTNIRQHIRMCAALAHLPPQYIDDGWLEIMETSPQTEQIVKFNDYFVSEWMESERMWICFKNRHRTTNTVEGWHTRINKKIGKSHPNIYELIKALFEEAVYYDIDTQREDMIFSRAKRSRKYIVLDQQINDIIDAFLQDPENLLMKTLHRLSYVVKYE